MTREQAREKAERLEAAAGDPTLDEEIVAVLLQESYEIFDAIATGVYGPTTTRLTKADLLKAAQGHYQRNLVLGLAKWDDTPASHSYPYKKNRDDLIRSLRAMYPEHTFRITTAQGGYVLLVDGEVW